VTKAAPRNAPTRAGRDAPPEDCPFCGRKLRGLMAADPNKPGFGGLLRGEGEDRLMIAVAWIAALIVIFGAAALAFAAMSGGLQGRL
jgi:hypothetical protein